MAVGTRPTVLGLMWPLLLGVGGCGADPKADLSLLILEFADSSGYAQTHWVELGAMRQSAPLLDGVDAPCADFLARLIPFGVAADFFQASTSFALPLSPSGAAEIRMPRSLEPVLFLSEGFAAAGAVVTQVAGCTAWSSGDSQSKEIVVRMVRCTEKPSGPICGETSQLCDCVPPELCRESTLECVTGTVGEGCDDDGDCLAVNHCQQSTRQCVDGGIGEPCDDDGDCDADNHCYAATQCEGGSVGDPCVDDDDCDAGNHCYDATQCEAGAVGDPCVDDDDCDAGNHCRDSREECVGGEPNDPCDNDSDCDDGNYCNNHEHRCVAGEVGDLCEDHGDCDPQNFCDGNTCAADLDVGGVCSGDAACLSGFCEKEQVLGEWVCCPVGEDCCLDDRDIDCLVPTFCQASTHLCVNGRAGSPCDDADDCSVVFAPTCNAIHVCE